MFSCNFFLVATCIVLAAIFFVILYFWNKMSRLGMRPVIVGMAVFFAFAVVFENIAHAFFLTIADERAQRISKSFMLYLFYGCSMAGIFEETGRYFAFRDILPLDSKPKAAIGYGFGHGGIELVIHGIIYLLMVAPESFGLQESFLWIGERVVAFCGHVALSIVVFTAVKVHRKLLYFLAIGLHAIADIPIGLYKFGMIDQLTCFIIFACFVLFCCLGTAKCWRFFVEEGRVG